MNPPRDPISRMRPNAINGVISAGKLGKQLMENSV